MVVNLLFGLYNSFGETEWEKCTGNAVLGEFWCL